MTELDQSARDVLAGYRSARSPTPEARARAREDVQKRIAAGDDIELVDDELTDAGPRRAWPKVVGGALALAAGIALVAALGGLEWVRTSAESAEPMEAPYAAPAKAPAAVAEPQLQVSPAAPAPERESTPSQLTEDDDAAADEQPAAGNKARRPKPAEKRSPEPVAKASVGTLKAEMALLGQAAAALQAGKPKRALQLFDKHARLYPQGILSEERKVKRMVALCELGRGEQARTAAKRFLRDHRGSPLAAHVSAICPDDG